MTNDQSQALAARGTAQQAQSSAVTETQLAQQQAGWSQQQAMQAQEATNALKGRTPSVIGTIVNVAPGEVSVSQGKRGEISLQVNGATQITLNGKKVGAEQLLQGSEVRASYAPGPYLPIAIRIDATSPRDGIHLPQPRPIPAVP